jgi:predicted DNA-binding antitoxin AbrB/MazE fold protein
MEKRIQAVYKGGALHPLEPLALEEMQEVTVSIGTPGSEFATDAELAAFFGKDEWEAAKDDPVTHEEAQRALSAITGSLSDTVIALREER